jgi:hypothetical protein
MPFLLEVGMVRGRVYRAYAAALGAPACMALGLAFALTQVGHGKQSHHAPTSIGMRSIAAMIVY